MMYAALGFAAGALLGALHFGGLWRTVRQIDGTAMARTLLLSFVLRFLVTCGGLWLLALVHPVCLVGAVFGILLARHLVRRMVLRSSARPNG